LAGAGAKVRILVPKCGELAFRLQRHSLTFLGFGFGTAKIACTCDTNF
jgi:hypothetical protein